MWQLFYVYIRLKRLFPWNTFVCVIVQHLVGPETPPHALRVQPRLHGKLRWSLAWTCTASLWGWIISPKILRYPLAHSKALWLFLRRECSHIFPRVPVHVSRLLVMTAMRSPILLSAHMDQHRLMRTWMILEITTLLLDTDDGSFTRSLPWLEVGILVSVAIFHKCRIERSHDSEVVSVFHCNGGNVGWLWMQVQNPTARVVTRTRITSWCFAVPVVVGSTAGEGISLVLTLKIRRSDS